MPKKPDRVGKEKANDFVEDVCEKCGTAFSQQSIDHGRCYGHDAEGLFCGTMVCAVVSKPSSKWEDDIIQFPRLLAEIMVTQDTLDMTSIAESMDLEVSEVSELFDRADTAWESFKSKDRELEELELKG